MSPSKTKEIKKFLISLGRKDLANKVPKYAEPWQYTQFINTNHKLNYAEKEKMIKIINKE